MSTVYLFGDEAGNFDFSSGPGASLYFILTTVTMSSCEAGDRLQALRRRLTDRLLALASDLGTRKRRGAFNVAVDEAVRASARCTHRVAFWPNMSEPCLVVADYCTWAIQRKWERNDARSQALLADKISSEAEIEIAENE